MNGSSISESICKGVILDLSNENPIRIMSSEDEPIKAELENEFFKSMWNIQIENHVKRGGNGRKY